MCRVERGKPIGTIPGIIISGPDNEPDPGAPGFALSKVSVSADVPGFAPGFAFTVIAHPFSPPPVTFQTNGSTKVYTFRFSTTPFVVWLEFRAGAVPLGTAYVRLTKPGSGVP